jgi:dihydrofolate reductase
MARLIFGMNVSLDGYVDYDRFAPSEGLFRHYVQQAREVAGSIYGRRLYEIMAYWDEDRPEWKDDERDFAEAWRAQHKWVASHSLSEVGPNATLLGSDLEAEVRKVKDSVEGEIAVGGPVLARSLAGMGLIDAWRLYYHPVTLGHGDPFFVEGLPRLRLTAVEEMGEDVVRLTYERG